MEDAICAPEGASGTAPWTMEALKEKAELIGIGSETRASYDDALVSLIERLPVDDAGLRALLSAIATREIVQTEEHDDMPAGWLADRDPARYRPLLMSLMRLVGVPIANVPAAVPELLARLGAHANGDDAAWVLGAEQAPAFAKLLAANAHLGTLFLNRKAMAAAQMALAVADPSLSITRTACLGELPLPESLRELSERPEDEHEPIIPPKVLLVLPEVLSNVIYHEFIPEGEEDASASDAYYEWRDRLMDEVPGIDEDDSITLAAARSIVKASHGKAILALTGRLLPGGFHQDLRRMLVEEGLVAAAIDFGDTTQPPAARSELSLWILDGNRSASDPVYLMKLGSPAQRERFPHLFDEHDDAGRGADVARLAQAIEDYEEIPFVGARVEPRVILGQTNASLRFDDYETSVDVRKSMGNHLSSAESELDYAKLVKQCGHSARAFAKAHEHFMKSH